MIDAQARIDQLRAHGWRQGSILPTSVVEAARVQADGRWPSHIPIGDNDWLIVVSHPCDVRNRKPDTEPTVEVLVARPYVGKKSDSRATFGKNSRTLHLEGQLSGTVLKLVASAFERFTVDRLLLSLEQPDPQRQLSVRSIEVLIGWITKRYQRQAFPDDFDQAVNTAKAKDKVNDFLAANTKTLLGVFIAFATRTDQTPRFHAEFRLVVKTAAVQVDWAAQQSALETAFEDCWKGVDGVELDAVAVQANRFSIGEMTDGNFKKFDRDWISYEFDPDSGSAPGT